MTTKQDILNYLKNTPENTNINVIGTFLADYKNFPNFSSITKTGTLSDYPIIYYNLDGQTLRCSADDFLKFLIQLPDVSLYGHSLIPVPIDYKDSSQTSEELKELIDDAIDSNSNLYKHLWDKGWFINPQPYEP